jgi:hypothetical protein
VTATARGDPQREAWDRLGGRYEVRVLEPSPPAVTDPPWLADDPVASGEMAAGRSLVCPVATGDITWDELCQNEDDPELATWCADRWLGAWRRLPADLPAGFGSTRSAWHIMAEHVLAPARYQACGKIGLRWTHGGVGTPYFGNGRQVRLEGADLIVDEAPVTITTVREAAAAVGITAGAPTDVYSPTTTLDLDAPLTIDSVAAARLADWFGFGCSVLEELRAAAAPADEPSRVQIWPEHFDMSVDLGPEASGRRAGFGASPGDQAHPAPYLYVVPWAAQAAGPPWNDGSFAGASLGYEELSGAADQRSTAVTFFQSCSDALR